MKRRPHGMAMLLAITALVVIIAALSSIGLLVNIESRQTFFAETDAQIRQLLYSSIASAREMSQKQGPLNEQLKLPLSSLPEASSMTLRLSDGRVQVTASIGRRTQVQYLQFDTSGKLVSVAFE